MRRELEELLRKADAYLRSDTPMPLDLQTDLLNAGIDLGELSYNIDLELMEA